MSLRAMQDLARRVAALEKDRNVHTPQLTSSSIEDGAMQEYDRDGNLVQIIGLQHDGTHVAASVGGPTPPTPQPALVVPGPGGLRVIIDGSYVPGEDGSVTVSPMDFHRFDIVVTDDAFADPLDLAPKASTTSPQGGEAFILLPEAQHFTYVIARSLSGKSSAPSTGTAGTPLPAPAAPEPPVAPSESPTPIPSGIPGAILLRLPPAGDTPTIVDVFVSATSPVDITAGSPDYHGTSTGGALYEISELSPDPITGDARPLEYYQPVPDPLPEDFEPVRQKYYIVALARSAADPTLVADPSPEVEAEMRQITGPDVAVDAVWAGTVEAGRVTSGTTEAMIVLAGMLESRNPAGPEFGRVGLSAADGFYSYGAAPAGGTVDESPVLVHFPLDGTPNIVSGLLEASQLTVTGGATFRSASTFEPESSLTFEQGITAPKTPPAYVIGYNTLDLDVPTPEDVRAGLAIGHDGNLYTARIPSSGKSVVERYDPVTGARTGTFWSLNQTYDATGGMVYDSTHNQYLVLCRKPDLMWVLEQYTTAGVFKRRINTVTDATTGQKKPALGWDYTTGKPLIAYPVEWANLDVLVHTFNVDANGNYSWNTNSTMLNGSYNYDLGCIVKGQFDYGVERYILRRIASDGTSNFRAYNSSGTRASDHDWPSRGSVNGIYWDGTRFYALDKDRRLRYEGGRAKPDSAQSFRWSFDYRWYDSKTNRAITISRTLDSPLITATNYVFGPGDVGIGINGTGIPVGATISAVQSDTGNATMSAPATSTASGASATLTSTTHETLGSPRATFTMTKRARVTLTMAGIPVGRAGVQDPDKIRVYWGRGSTDALTTMVREKTLTAGATGFTFDPHATAEGGSPAAAFGNSTPARAQSDALNTAGLPMWQFKGDGFARSDMLSPPGLGGYWFESTAPLGWIALNGSNYHKDTSPTLAARWGTGSGSRYGSAPTDYFSTPDTRSRFLIGSGTFAALNATDGISEASRTPRHSHGAGGLVNSTTSHGGRNNAPTGGAQPVVGNIAGSESGNHGHVISGSTADNGASSIPYFSVLFIVKA